jgi:hypothetical protein
MTVATNEHFTKKTEFLRIDDVKRDPKGDFVGGLKFGNSWLGVRSDIDLTHIQPGDAFHFEIWIDEKGKRSVGRIVTLEDDSAATTDVPPLTAPLAISSTDLTEKDVIQAIEREKNVIAKKGEFRTREEIIRTSVLEMANKSPIFARAVEAAVKREDIEKALFDLANRFQMYVVEGK